MKNLHWFLMILLFLVLTMGLVIVGCGNDDDDDDDDDDDSENLGACCNSSNQCSVSVRLECNDGGGRWLGTSISCVPNPCSGDDDDDDDDDDTGDDDTGDDDTGDDDDDASVLEECVDWYTDCAGVDNATAQAVCEGLLGAYDDTDQCYVDALEDLFECLDENVDCDNWDEDDAEICFQNYTEDIIDCL